MGTDLAHTSNTRKIIPSKAYARRITELQKYFPINKRQHILANCKLNYIFIYYIVYVQFISINGILMVQVLSVSCLFAHSLLTFLKTSNTRPLGVLWVPVRFPHEHAREATFLYCTGRSLTASMTETGDGGNTWDGGK